MCGIFGSTRKSDAFGKKENAALNTLKHRGPDQQGEYIDEDVYMGHRRLSILDLSENGRQPMASEDGIIITVNGEIYNYKELKDELDKKYSFKSKSDSEVLLHGFREWGIEMLLNKIDGMYSFAVYDKPNKKIYLARDRYGIKPLYFTHLFQNLVWSSELKAIEKYYENVSLDVNVSAIYDYLTYLYIPSPKTLFKGIQKLEPAHYIVYDLNEKKLLAKRYWQLTTSDNKVDINQASSKIRFLIESSVKAQMISDVELGFFLSGGIDSSIVVATASKHSKKLKTFSIGFDIETHNETNYSRQVANLFRTDHFEKILDIKSANYLFERMRQWYDEPFSDTSALPSFLVSEFAKQNSTVVLTGDGGDELFGGYDWYFRYLKYSHRHLLNTSFILNVTSKAKRWNRYSLLGRAANQLEYRLLNDFPLYAKLLGGLLPYEKRSLKQQWEIPGDYDDYWHFRRFYIPTLSPKKRFQYLDFHTYLPDDIFTKVDRVSMSVSLECRVPFMNRELVEYAFSLPEEIIFYNNQAKGLLKYAFKDTLPLNILERPKRGFNIPVSIWGKDFLKGYKSQQELVLSMFFSKNE
jgi:asparagine synthase (glutamine-hydrolysing)